MKKSAICLLLALLCTPSWATAQTVGRPRLRMLVHANQPLDGALSLRAHIIPGGDLVEGLAPYLYVGLDWSALPWLHLEGDIGWDYTHAEPLISLMLDAKGKAVWAWGEVDLQLPSAAGYWFLQLQYQLSGTVHVGLEGEGWGAWVCDSWSYGGGPNLLLRMGSHVGLDMAIHVRTNQRKGETHAHAFLDPFFRVHLFF